MKRKPTNLATFRRKIADSDQANQAIKNDRRGQRIRFWPLDVLAYRVGGP